MKIKLIWFFVLLISLFSVSAETIYNDNFEDGDCSDWTSCSIESTIVKNGTYSGKETSTTMKSPNLDNINVTYNVTFWNYYQVDGVTYFVFGLYDGTNVGQGAVLRATAGDTFLKAGTGWGTTLNAKLYNKVWTKYTMEFNSGTAGIFNLYVNDTLTDSNVPFREDTVTLRRKDVDHFHLYDPANDFTSYLDDITKYNRTALPEPTDAYVIFGRNLANGSDINFFNATINGAGYNTTNGTIVTNFTHGDGYTVNISVWVDDSLYLIRNFTDINVSGADLSSDLYQAIIWLNATEKITSNTITGATYSTSYMDGNPIFTNRNDTIITFEHTNYFSFNVNLSVNRSYMNYTFGNITNTWINITAVDAVNGSTVDAFNITMHTWNGTSFSENRTTLLGNITYYLLKHTEYNFTIDAPSYTISQAILNLTNGSLNYQFSLFRTNSFNLTFYDEQTELQLNQTVFVELISDVASYNYTAPNGSLFVDLITPANYTIRYYSHTPEDYGRLREYFAILTPRSEEVLDLYLIKNSNSTQITTIVYDEVTLERVPNAIVYLQRYFVSDNSYRTVAMHRTDVNGQVLFDVEYATEYYKFRVDYPHLTQKLLTEPLYITATTINLYINLLADAFEEYFDINGISSSITFSDANGAFTASWNDAENVGTEYCLYIKKYGRYALETLNSSCSTASTGTITLSGLNTTTTNYATFTTRVDGIEKTISSAFKEYYADTLPIGNVGPFYTVLIVIVMVFVAPLHYLALIMATVGLILAKLIGLAPLSWGLVGGLLLGSIILSIIVEKFRQ